MPTDFMGVKRICRCCKSNDDTVCWSEEFTCYICDDCYADNSPQWKAKDYNKLKEE